MPESAASGRVWPPLAAQPSLMLLLARSHPIATRGRRASPHSSAVHGAAASACCTDAVLSGASGTCVCERWWALGEPQGRPDLDDIIDALQKWMFDHLRVDLFRPLRLGGSTGMSGHSPRPSDRRQHLSCGVERRSSDVSSPDGRIMFMFM